MTPLMVVQLIIQYGLPFAQKLAQLVEGNLPLSPADWAALNALASQTARSKMLDALAKTSIDPASPQGVALLALTAGT